MSVPNETTCKSILLLFLQCELEELELFVGDSENLVWYLSRNFALTPVDRCALEDDGS